METEPMIDLTKEQKLQIVAYRRQGISRNIFETQLDIVIMNHQGRTDEVGILNKRIEELQGTDAALVEFANSL